jgi:hypothetical protein
VALASKVLGVDVQKKYHSAKEDAQTVLSIYKMVEKDWIDDVSVSGIQEMLRPHDQSPVTTVTPIAEPIKAPSSNYPPSVTIDAWLSEKEPATTPKLRGLPSQSTIKKTSAWVDSIDMPPPAKFPRASTSHTSPTVIDITDEEEIYYTGEEDIETLELRAAVDLDFEMPTELEVFFLEETHRDGFQRLREPKRNQVPPIELSGDSMHPTDRECEADFRRFQKNRSRKERQSSSKRL